MYGRWGCGDTHNELPNLAVARLGFALLALLCDSPPPRSPLGSLPRGRDREMEEDLSI